MKRNALATVSLCVAIGGLGTVIIMCWLIGFGFHTTVGKEALYVCFALQSLNLLCMRLQQKEDAAPSREQRLCNCSLGLVWLAGATMLLVSLVLILFGVSKGNFWVKTTCIAGFVAAQLGWLGLLLMPKWYTRKKQ